jgi:aspartyl-tRNA(Asn)/glutamyl-tRNA(Gln) amidotransferase subunit C
LQIFWHFSRIQKNEILTFPHLCDILSSEASVPSRGAEQFFFFGGVMDKKALARLELLNQIKLDDAQKEEVLSFFAKREEELVSFDEINTSQIEPMVHAIPAALSLREDAVEQPFAPQDLLAQAPQTDAGYFCVPRVIE